jgi:hypothetical protein
MSRDRTKRAERLLAALPPRLTSDIIWNVELIEDMLRLREVEKLTFLALVERMGISRSAIQRFRALSGWHPAPVNLKRGVRPIARPTYSADYQKRHRQRRRIAQSEELRP